LHSIYLRGGKPECEYACPEPPLPVHQEPGRATWFSPRTTLRTPPAVERALVPTVYFPIKNNSNDIKNKSKGRTNKIYIAAHIISHK